MESWDTPNRFFVQDAGQSIDVDVVLASFNRNCKDTSYFCSIRVHANSSYLTISSRNEVDMVDK